MSIPLRGQGNPLPVGFPYDGQWILEPRMFLFVSEDETTIDPTARFTTHINQADDNWSFGFDAVQLAVALGIEVHETLLANRERRLNLEMIETDTPGGEGVTTKRYTFSVGDKLGSLTIATPSFSGTA
jgi:hypothetical protein